MMVEALIVEPKIDDCRGKGCRGEGGTGDGDRKRIKSFVVNILTSKPLALKILPRIGVPKPC
jgi:hypothetical protein